MKARIAIDFPLRARSIVQITIIVAVNLSLTLTLLALLLLFNHGFPLRPSSAGGTRTAIFFFLQAPGERRVSVYRYGLLVLLLRGRGVERFGEGAGDPIRRQGGSAFAIVAIGGSQTFLKKLGAFFVHAKFAAMYFGIVVVIFGDTILDGCGRAIGSGSQGRRRSNRGRFWYVLSRRVA